MREAGHDTRSATPAARILQAERDYWRSCYLDAEEARARAAHLIWRMTRAIDRGEATKASILGHQFLAGHAGFGRRGGAG